jgi:hypothetical protein
MLALFLMTGFAGFSSLASAAAPTGDYLETRTCDVYTGPCFANAEVGLTGKEALLAWHIDSGTFRDVDLSGLSVVMAVRSKDTLGSDAVGYGSGLVKQQAQQQDKQAEPVASVLFVDRKATTEQRTALVEFARARAGSVAGDTLRVSPAAIDLTVDHVEMVGKLRVDSIIEVQTRKLGGHDCVCTNEIVFYPPLTDVENAAPAYTVEGRFHGRGLGSQWSNTKSRSSFLATFGNPSDTRSVASK